MQESAVCKLTHHSVGKSLMAMASRMFPTWWERSITLTGSVLNLNNDTDKLFLSVFCYLQRSWGCANRQCTAREVTCRWVERTNDVCSDRLLWDEKLQDWTQSHHQQTVAEPHEKCTYFVLLLSTLNQFVVWHYFHGESPTTAIMLELFIY